MGKGMGGLKNWTIFMDVTYVSFLTCLDFPILRFHAYTPKIFLVTSLFFVKIKCFLRRKMNSWFLSTIIWKGCLWFSMISINVNGKEIWKIEHCEVPKKLWIGIWNRPSCQWNTILSAVCSFCLLWYSVNKNE